MALTREQPGPWRRAQAAVRVAARGVGCNPQENHWAIGFPALAKFVINPTWLHLGCSRWVSKMIGLFFLLSIPSHFPSKEKSSWCQTLLGIWAVRYYRTRNQFVYQLFPWIFKGQHLNENLRNCERCCLSRDSYWMGLINPKVTGRAWPVWHSGDWIWDWKSSEPTFISCSCGIAFLGAEGWFSILPHIQEKFRKILLTMILLG